MSKNASPSKAHIFLDGDGWRAPAGTALPANPFAETLAAAWDPFGGIEAGFGVSHERERKSKSIWNAEGEYKTSNGAKISSAKLKAVDLTKATVKTILRGGSVVQVSAATVGPPAVPAVYRWDEGADEEFACLLVGREGDAMVAYYAARTKLNNDPDEAVNDDDLFGFDMELKFLSPDGGGPAVVRYTSFNPLA